MSLPKAVAITLNWKNAGDTIECIESLLRQDYPDFHVLILDNGSADGSAERLEKWGRQRYGDEFLSLDIDEVKPAPLLRRIHLFRSEENLGFTGGNNALLRHAVHSGARYIWLINNDTVQDAAALRELVNVAEADESIGMVCSKVLYFDRPDRIESMGAFLVAPLGIFRHIGQGKKDPGRTAAREVPYIYGCSLLVRAEMVMDVGPLDERYFLLCEEADWSVRARERGWKLLCAPGSRVRHRVTASMGRRSDIFFYYVTRNTFLFMKEHHPLFLPATLFFMFPMALGLAFVDALLTGRKFLARRLKAVLRGYRDFLSGKYGRMTD